MIRNNTIDEHYRRNYGQLVKRIVRRVPNQSSALAEEVVQEAYARALKYFPAFDEKVSSFENWFSKILKNSINDCRGAESGNSKEYDDNVEDIRQFKDEYKNITHILAEIIHVGSYSARDYNIIKMFFLFGFTSKDIAIYLGITHTNVRQVIFKFRNRMNEVLNGRD